MVGVAQLDRNGQSSLALFFLRRRESPRWPTLAGPRSASEHTSQLFSNDPNQRGISALQPPPQPRVGVGQGGCRGAGLQQNPLLCPVQVLPLQHQLPRPTPGAHYKINKCSPRFPVPLEPRAVPCQGGREWPNGQRLSSGYSFPTHTSLLGIKIWRIKRRVQWIRTGVWWVHMAPLSVSLFATFTLV